MACHRLLAGSQVERYFECESAREETRSSQSVPATVLSTAFTRGTKCSMWDLRSDPSPDPAIAMGVLFVRHSCKMEECLGAALGVASRASCVRLLGLPGSPDSWQARKLGKLAS